MSAAAGWPGFPRSASTAIGSTVDAVRMRIARCKQKLRAKFGLDGGTESAG